MSIVSVAAWLLSGPLVVAQYVGHASEFWWHQRPWNADRYPDDDDDLEAGS